VALLMSSSSLHLAHQFPSWWPPWHWLGIVFSLRSAQIFFSHENFPTAKSCSMALHSPRTHTSCLILFDFCNTYHFL
jgi:hypothetical protein